MSILKKSALIVAVLGFALLTTNMAKAESNPFTSTDVATTVDKSEAKAKCGEGKKEKCGEGKKAKCGEGKCGEGKKAKCGEGKKAKCGEGKCGEGKKAKCGEGKKAPEKKCGE